MYLQCDTVHLGISDSTILLEWMGENTVVMQFATQLVAQSVCDFKCFSVQSQPQGSSLRQAILVRDNVKLNTHCDQWLFSSFSVSICRYDLAFFFRKKRRRKRKNLEELGKKLIDTATSRQWTVGQSGFRCHRPPVCRLYDQRQCAQGFAITGCELSLREFRF